MASIPFLMPHEMLEAIAQANPETIEAFVAANIQEPQLFNVRFLMSDLLMTYF